MVEVRGFREKLRAYSLITELVTSTEMCGLGEEATNPEWNNTNISSERGANQI